MTEAQILTNLEHLLSQIEVEVRWDDGDFTGGLCRMGPRRVCVVNRALPTARKVDLLCQALSGMDLSRVFVLPAIRARIAGKCHTREDNI